MRLVLAETLKIRKSRGLVIASVLLTLGIGVLVMVVPELYRLDHPLSQYVGGQRGLAREAIAIGFLGSIAAMIVGSAVGTGDISTGVLRDLVATGRARSTLFFARVPGALVFWVPLVAVSFLVASLLDVWFSNHSALSCIAVTHGGALSACGVMSGQAPPLHQFVEWFLWVLVYTAFLLLVTIGLASWVGSRAITLGILIPFQLFVAPILGQIHQLAGVRELLYTQSIARIEPSFATSLGMSGVFGQLTTRSLTVAWLVLFAWVAVLLGVGLWRTITRDV